MDNQRITEAEWKVMEIIWENHDIFASDIAEKLEDTIWSIQTVKTLLSRLVNKGYIGHRKDGRAFRYKALVSREESIKNEREGFIQKIFKGSKREFFANFIKTEKLTSDEIGELKRLIDEMDDENGLD